MSELLLRVEELARQAALLMKKDHFQVLEKDGSANIVTESDLAIENFLKKELTALIEGSTFFGEEGDERKEGDYIWIVDPIDGTQNYARGLGNCVISIGLLHHDEVILGVVYNPYSEELYKAEKGQGAFLNDRPIHVSNRKFEDGLLCTALSLYRKEYADICGAIILDAYKECNDVRRFGSCAVELCYLASGRCDLYFEIRIFPWDYSGSEIILREAGGLLVGYDGLPLDHKKETVLIGANNDGNLARLISIINRHLKKKPY